MRIDDDDHGVPSADEEGGGEVATRPRREFERTRLRLGVVIALVCAAIAFVVIQGLGDATTYFLNADEAVARRTELGDDRFRLQGTVVEGSVEDVGSNDAPAVRFDVEFHCDTVPVLHEGNRPELFQPGIPVVLEGAYADDDDVYRSDSIIVKHTEEYSAEEKERLERADEEACRT